jgi:hypothetical protein
MSAIRCWLDAHNGAITAIATFVIAAFTIVLAWVSKAQAKLIDDQLKLARAEFSVTHRPRIIVRSFQMVNIDIPVGERPRFIFIAHNMGDSPGRLIEIRSGTLVLEANERIPNDLAFPHHEDLNATLASGQKVEVSVLVNNEAMEIFAEAKLLLCLGTIVYLDGAGNRRETGFCRRYKPDTRQWDSFESEYEYAY